MNVFFVKGVAVQHIYGRQLSDYKNKCFPIPNIQLDSQKTERDGEKLKHFITRARVVRADVGVL